MEPKKQRAKLSTVATFPKGYFIENLAVRSDNSLLVTSLKTHELWYVPPSNLGEEVTPALLCTFDKPPMSLVEPEQDVFYLCHVRRIRDARIRAMSDRSARMDIGRVDSAETCLDVSSRGACAERELPDRPKNHSHR
jgi:hypothetical protein